MRRAARQHPSDLRPRAVTQARSANRRTNETAGGRGRVVTSSQLNRPALVHREIWGHLCCHFAIRTLMFEAAHAAGVDPDRVSFTAAVDLGRRSRSQARGFSPSAAEAAWRRAVVLLLRRLNPTRRLRSAPRLIKQKMPKWHVNRAPTRQLAPARPSTGPHHPRHRRTERHCS